MKAPLKIICLVFLLPLLQFSCGNGSALNPSQVHFQYSYGGGTVKGTITNNSARSISSIEADVQILGDRGRILLTKQVTIKVKVSAGSTEEFQVFVGGAAGARSARIHTKTIR